MKDAQIIVKGIIKHGDEYLLVKKWYDDRIVEPYEWEFVDARISVGESPDNAVDQLVSDTTFLMVANKKILYTWTYSIEETGYVGLAYLCEVESDIVILNEELHDYKWVKKDEIPDFITNKLILDDVMRVL